MVRPLILVTALCSLIPASFASGPLDDAVNNRTTNVAHPARSAPGYHGPIALGPLSINNKAGAIEFNKLLSILKVRAAPSGATVCYRDSANGVYLVIERGTDNPRLVRGLTLSRLNVCPEKMINQANGFSTWITDKGIRLGSSERAVISHYGEPSQIDELHTDPEFYFSPYPPGKNSSGLSKEGRVLSYLPKENAPDTSHAFFGIRGGIVVWMTVSDNE